MPSGKNNDHILPFGNSPWGDSSNNNKSQGFEDIFRKTKSSLPNFEFKNDQKKLFIYIAAGLTTLWLLTGFYIIEEKEQAVVLRFGKYVRTATAGPNYHLPFPLETVIKEKVDEVRVEEIGSRNSFNTTTSSPISSSARTNLLNRAQTKKNISEESLMLTGDENIVDINFQVQWKINNIKNYLFNLQSSKETVRSAAESAMREVIGSTPISEAETYGKSVIEQRAKDLMQQILDSYKSGVEVNNFKLLKADPPAEVIDAQRDVQAARADKEREINQAQSYLNDILPKARGEGSKIVRDGEAYSKEVVERASGEASRFNSVYEEYKKDKTLTRKRMYFETLEKTLGDIDKIIIDTPKNSGVVPYLPLPQFEKLNKDDKDAKDK